MWYQQGIGSQISNHLFFNVHLDILLRLAASLFPVVVLLALLLTGTASSILPWEEIASLTFLPLG
jgi:hypothetical protein